MQGSLVVCFKCSKEGKRFKMESVWEWDDQKEAGGHWLHTCAVCIMTREGFSSVEAAQAWIIDTARAVTSVLLQCIPAIPKFSISIT